jgi:hypothetical protein
MDPLNVVVEWFAFLLRNLCSWKVLLNNIRIYQQYGFTSTWSLKIRTSACFIIQCFSVQFCVVCVQLSTCTSQWYGSLGPSVAELESYLVCFPSPIKIISGLTRQPLQHSVPIEISHIRISNDIPVNKHLNDCIVLFHVCTTLLIILSNSDTPMFVRKSRASTHWLSLQNLIVKSVFTLCLSR